MYLNLISKQFAFYCLLLFYPILTAQGQATKSSLKNGLFNNSFPISASSFNLTLITGLTQKASIHREAGMYDIKTSAQPHFELGIDYQHRLKDKYFVGFGIHLIGTGRNLVYKVPVEEINSNLYQDPEPPTKFTDFDFGVAIPFFLERQWKLRANRNIYTSLSLQFHYSFESDISYGDSYIDTGNNYIDVFHLDLNTNNKNKPWFTYSLGGGYQWILKNNNLLKIGLVANFSFTHFVNGNYQITIPGEPITQGTYHVTGSYLGIAASYGFTGLNRKLVRRYEE